MIRKQLEAIVGKKYVLDDKTTLDAYAGDSSLNPHRRPLFVVKPKGTKEVQKLVKLANQQLIPLIPVSSETHFYGATIPEQGGIVLDLTRMDRILEIDIRNRKVKIEPGVTWPKLQKALKEKDQMALAPLFPHPGISALSSSLERSPMLIPKYEYADPVLTMEVVLPQGEHFLTGSAAAANSQQAYPEGPGLDFYRFFQGAQGTMGVVTWLNIKTEYLPKHQKVFFVAFDRIEDAVEPIYQLQRRHIGNECFLLNNFHLAQLLAEAWPGDFEDLRHKLPPYTLTVVIAGGRRRPLERIAYEEEALQEIASQLHFHPAVTLGGISGLEALMLEKLRTPQETATYWKTRFKGAVQDIFFICDVDRAALYYNQLVAACAKFHYPLQETGVYLQPLERGRACHLEFSLPCSPGDGDQNLRDLYLHLSNELISLGAFFSRPYGPWAEMVYSSATVYTNTLKELKNVFDPNNILNPGKLCF
jgi:FAD/FMN-containing dehydrogenase